MGKALCEASARAREVYAAADRVTGLPITELCVSGAIEELTRTDRTQVAMFATSLAVAAALEEALGFAPTALGTGGHSVGELAAICWAGALSLEDGLALVYQRGLLMERDSNRVDGTMVAVLGLDTERLESVCTEASKQSSAHVQVANLNAPGQVVISGARVAVEAAATLAQAAGASRVLPLNVGGPFHSVYMSDAAVAFASLCSHVAFSEARFPVVLNTTAAATTEPEALRDELSGQITRPVRWAESVQTLSRLGCTVFLELGPGRVLGGLVRRTLPDATVVSAGDTEALAGAAQIWTNTR